MNLRGWSAKSKACARRTLMMRTYLDLLERILNEGVERPDRTGTGTLSIFGHQMRFDLSTTLPAITTKRVHWPSVVHELLWFISGETNISYLRRNGVSIWDEWADNDGELGPVYGKQWRRWEGKDGVLHDQMERAIRLIKKEPTSRRILVSAWNVGELENMALMPCHAVFQYYVANGKLSCHLYQRSGDAFLGIPFNISSYSILTAMVAQITGLKLGEFVHTIGDAHLYMNHLSQAREQVSRTPLKLPTLYLNPECKAIDEFRFNDIVIQNYTHLPHIPAPIAI